MRSCKGGSGFGVQVQVQGFRVKVLGVGFRVQGLGSGFTVEKTHFDSSHQVLIRPNLKHEGPMQLGPFRLGPFFRFQHFV